MRKYIPYLLVLVILVAGGLLVFSGNNEKQRKLDQRMSFSPEEKIPYGTWVAYQGLSRLFPRATILRNLLGPGDWDTLSTYKDGQALIVVSPIFNAAEYEMKKILRFADAGNDVLVSAAQLSSDVKDLLRCNAADPDFYNYYLGNEPQDSLTVSLNQPPFAAPAVYRYPGRRMDGHFYNLDTAITTVLGTDSAGDPNFVHFRVGKGNLYVHLAPLSFTNYFLLRDSNLRYYSQILSVISPDTRTLVWDEYFLKKRYDYDQRSGQNRSWLSALFEYPSLRWGILTALLALLVYTLMEARRKQRMIPVIRAPRNDSLDFVRTIGRLYYDKGDHRNLCRKMAAFFLDHVRSRYKLATNSMDEAFVQSLHHKSGIAETDIRAIVFFIQEMEGGAQIGDHQLTFFHKKLESFYEQSV